MRNFRFEVSAYDKGTGKNQKRYETARGRNFSKANARAIAGNASYRYNRRSGAYDLRG
ncbi:MAG: hypothetical protein LBJ57_06375 [Prevotellaceae bacterium]|jgi:hypothetical protein|nr:hypothetical protein [Prevotellaceae bacterium]